MSFLILSEARLASCAKSTPGTVLRLPLFQILTFLGLNGVVVDPTTAGLGDSERAMGYVEPWDDNEEK